MTTYTPAVLTTGADERGNLFSFWKSPQGWVDGYNEQITEEDFIRAHVFPNVQKVYFSNIVLTGAEWVEAGCPMSLSDEQMTAIEQATALEALPEAEQVAAEVANDDRWLGRIDAESLPNLNTNGNLQWQGVEFDIPAIVERTQARSAELKAQIDARAAAVKSLNAKAEKNVRLGVKR